MTMNWTENLKEGDKVIMRRGYNAAYVEKVERVTATLVICCGFKFRRKDGQRIGGGNWSGVSISEWNATDQAIIDRDKKLGEFKSLVADGVYRRLSDLDLDLVLIKLRESKVTP